MTHSLASRKIARLCGRYVNFSHLKLLAQSLLFASNINYFAQTLDSHNLHRYRLSNVPRSQKHIAKLVEQASLALMESDERALPYLQELLKVAAPGTQAALYAHRHMAEVLLNENPWQSALHIRQALTISDDDDVLHALMGLSQALLGNYRASVQAYQRATRLGPHVAWYQHNLGHLMDAALDRSEEALPYLRKARELDPADDEVAASLAQCLARLDQFDEAMDLARHAFCTAEVSDGHRDLIRWINARKTQALAATSS